MAQLKIVDKYNKGGPRFQTNTVEAAGQSYSAGDLVTVAALAVTLATTDPAAVYGIAQTAATGVTGTAAVIEMIEPYDILEGYVGATAPLAANHNVKYSVAVAAGSNSITIAGTGSNKTFFITDLLIDPITGLYKTTVRGQFIPTCLQSGVGTS